jgi:hypothetical protein
VLILLNALLWTLILSRERFGVSSWLRVLSIWVLLTTVSLHRLGASFVRTSISEHGTFGLRHRLVSLTVLGAVLAAFAWSIVEALPALSSTSDYDVPGFLTAVAEAAQQPLPTAVTYPFRALVRPLAAHTPAEWLVAIGPAVVLLVLHYIWVVRSDTAFQEAAAEVSLRRAQALSGGRRAGDPQPRRASRITAPLIRLSPNGWPAGAILWKNLVAGTRIKRIRNAALILGAAGLIVGALSFDPDGTLAEIAGWLAVFWAALMVVTGPQYVRNDLRGDLLKLDLLRSYPLRGWSVVLAEAGASTLMLTMIQFSLLTIGYLAFLGNQTMAPPLKERTLLLLGSFAVLPAINLLSMLIQNGAALLYPAWVRLGSGRPGGVEVLGQNMLMMIAFVAVLAGTLVLPVIVGGGAFLLFRATLENWAVIPAALVGLGLIGFEAALIVDWLGRIFERTDPASAGIVV